MTIGELLALGTRQLEQAGIESARLDVLLLLEDALDRDRASILAHLDERLPEAILNTLNTQFVQRSTHLPLAYIRGRVAFYGRNFVVEPGVLVPRPETEAMIPLLTRLNFSLPPHSIPLRIADIGTGSGCLGITAALEIPKAQVDLYDIDTTALGVAASNAKKHHVKVGFYHEDMLTNATHRRYDVLLANLPYVPAHHPLNKAAKHEPTSAIFAGADGLDAYRKFWHTVPRLEWQPQYILTEALTTQHAALSRFAMAAGYEHVATDGLAQQFTLQKRLNS